MRNKLIIQAWAYVLGVSILASNNGTAEQPQKSQKDVDSNQLTVERIFSPSFKGDKFGPFQWLPWRPGLASLEKSEGDAQQIVWHDPETGEEEILVSADQLIPHGEDSPLKIDNFQFSDGGLRLLIYTNSKRVWRKKTRGDYWVLDTTISELKQLGGDVKPASMMFATFSPDGTRVCYASANNLYVQNLRNLEVIQLTKDGCSNIINGSFDWVYEEEFRLRKGFRWSPDGNSIAYWQLNTEGVREFNLINNTDSLYPKLKPIKYPKAGDQNSACHLGVVGSGGGVTKWLQVQGDPRNHYLAGMDWIEHPQEVIFQQLNRLQNSVKVMLGNPMTGESKMIHADSDDAWLDVRSELEWMGKNERLLWLSEKDGWRRINVVTRSGEKVTGITPAGFDVIDIKGVDNQNDYIYFMASPDDPKRRYLYRIKGDGSEMARVTPGNVSGMNSYNISPDCSLAVHTFSTFDTPPVIALIKLPSHEVVKVLRDNANLTDQFKLLARRPVEFFRINIGGDVLLDGWSLTPPDFDKSKKYPVMVYVYGEPAGQTVMDRWGGRTMLWHLMLAQQGYVVMSFDNRGTSAPRGREWRKSIYRQVGILASKDQAAALSGVLKERPYLDPDRVGVWGWSGGGSMSLNGIFRYPDLYKTAIAVAFISNQRYYDTIYQERYMALPKQNVDGYREGSPINHAHRLKGDLLLIYGTGDDNCHYQNCEALVNKLISHNKHFSMMAYPNRTHGISEGKNTKQHLYGLMTEFLYRTLPRTISE